VRLPFLVIPAKAGIHPDLQRSVIRTRMDSRFRGNDGRLFTLPVSRGCIGYAAGGRLFQAVSGVRVIWIKLAKRPLRAPSRRYE